MKLLHLKLDTPFRSLQAGFELDFLREWDRRESIDLSDHSFAPYVLAGPNGSGKSNVLEVLAAIFHHVECQYLDYRPAGFDYDEADNPGGFREEVASPDAFALEYWITTPSRLRDGDAPDTAHIRIHKRQAESPRLYWLNRPVQSGTEPLSRMDAREMLPEFVLGYSSGENEVLSLPFFKARFIQFDEYRDSECLFLLDEPETHWRLRPAAVGDLQEPLRAGGGPRAVAE